MIRPAETLPTPSQMSAIKAWNLMGGQIEWPAVPVMVEMFGVQDVEQFIRNLSVIRESMRET